MIFDAGYYKYSNWKKKRPSVQSKDEHAAVMVKLEHRLALKNVIADNWGAN